MDYVITGRLALCVYVKPCFTDRIDVLCREGTAAEVAALMPAARIAINIRQVESRPDQQALDMPLTVDVFGMAARFICPEYLLWQCLSNDDAQSSADAIALIQSGVFNVSSFCDMLAHHDAWLALDRFQQMWMRAKMQQSYSESVALRLSRRTNGSEKE